MSRLITSFYYRVRMDLLLGSKSYEIKSENIKSITTNYEYDKNTMPIIYLGLRLNPELYDKFVLNAENASVRFSVFKFDPDATSEIEKTYINDRFIYIMTSDPNYSKSMLQATNSVEDGSPDSYMEGYIALMNLRIINDNKRLFNTILKNVNLASIIHHFTNHMTMCIEPLSNNPDIDQIIIPPISSITNLLEFLNNNYCFYPSGYRYFRDFTRTYLLSNSGVSTPDKTTAFNTIIVNIVDPLDDLGSTNSIELNRDAKAYIINVDANDTNIHIDRTVDKTVNSVIGVDINGNTEQIVLDIPTNAESTEKVLLERVYGNNLLKVHNTKHVVESSSITITVTKADMDGTILTPNKEYFVRNYDANKKYDGRYILTFKKEVLYQIGEACTSNVVFGLRKVNEDS